MSRGSFHFRQCLAMSISAALPIICIAPSPEIAITARFGCANFAASA